MDDITTTLSTILNGCLRRRIKREIDKLIELEICKDNIVWLKPNINHQHNNLNTYTISFNNIKNNNYYYEFVLSQDYPFKSPKLIINSKHYSHYLKIQNNQFRNALIKYNFIDCFCCESILCGNNWTPHYQLTNILSESYKFKNICREIAYRIIINAIKLKYLVYDINIAEWLF